MFANDFKNLEWLYTHCGCKNGDDPKMEVIWEKRQWSLLLKNEGFLKMEMTFKNGDGSKMENGIRKTIDVKILWGSLWKWIFDDNGLRNSIMSKEELWGNIGSEEVCCRFSIVCAQKLSSKMFLSGGGTQKWPKKGFRWSRRAWKIVGREKNGPNLGIFIELWEEQKSDIFVCMVDRFCLNFVWISCCQNYKIFCPETWLIMFNSKCKV